jgi:hypothetical protein
MWPFIIAQEAEFNVIPVAPYRGSGSTHSSTDLRIPPRELVTDSVTGGMPGLV